MKKKILFVINSLGCGGAEKSLVSLLSLMDYQRYDVDLLMFNPGGMFMSLLPQAVHVLPQPAYLRYCANGGFSLRYAATRLRTSVGIRLHPKCKGRPLHDAQAYWKYACAAFDPLPEQYDVAIAWGQGNPTHFVAEKVRAQKKIAWVNVNYEAAGHQAAFDEPYYEGYDGIVCVSEELRSLFSKVFPQYGKKTVTILDINNPKTITSMAQKSISLPNEDGLKLVTVGRLVPQKGYDIAAKAAWLLKKRGIRFHWYVVGGGNTTPIKKDIAQYGIHECFTLLGAKANPYPYMKAADIYVQTSKFEGYCLTLAEARMLNIPCVTTNFDVAYAQMIDGENGLVVEMNAEAVADGIIRLATDPELYQHIKRYQEQEKKGNVEEIEKFYELAEKVDD